MWSQWLFLVPIAFLLAAIGIFRYYGKRRKWIIIPVSATALAVSVVMMIYAVPLWILQIDSREILKAVLDTVDFALLTKENLTEKGFDGNGDGAYQYFYTEFENPSDNRWYENLIYLPVGTLPDKELRDIPHKKAHGDFYYCSTHTNIGSDAFYIVEFVDKNGYRIEVSGRFRDKTYDHFNDMYGYLEKLLDKINGEDRKTS